MTVVPYLKTHLWYLAAIGLLLVAGHAWLAEHDARLMAEQTAKVAEQKFADYQKQVDAVNAAASVKVAAIEKQATAVKTPVQAIAAIPDVSTLPLHVAPVPTAPEAVQVDALALYQTLSACQVDKIKLDACGQSSALKDQQIGEQKQAIAALRKPAGFWHRVVGTLKAVGVGIGIGAVIGAKL